MNQFSLHKSNTSEVARAASKANTANKNIRVFTETNWLHNCNVYQFIQWSASDITDLISFTSVSKYLISSLI